MKRYYELHITLDDAGDPDTRMKMQNEVLAYGWKFSAIDGDPVTGPGVKCYATTHLNERFGEEAAIKYLHRHANSLDEAFRVTRRKVELVLYDDRSSKVRPCDGGCPECHLDDIVGNRADTIIPDELAQEHRDD